LRVCHGDVNDERNIAAPKDNGGFLQK
jgi:hypothetical protein